MRKILLFFLGIFIISNALALCDNNQIDINTASLEELDGLSGIGPVKAQAIIDSRPFDSVDRLIDVYGIGEITLENIKEQGLACVSNEKESEEEDESEIEDDEEIEEETNEEETKLATSEFKESQEISNNINSEKGLEAIVLNKITPQSIKSEDNNEKLDKNKLAIYGLILLCILLAFLFIMRKKENEKSEFK